MTCCYRVKYNRPEACLGLATRPPRPYSKRPTFEPQDRTPATTYVVHVPWHKGAPWHLGALAGSLISWQVPEQLGTSDIPEFYLPKGQMSKEPSQSAKFPAAPTSRSGMNSLCRNSLTPKWYNTTIPVFWMWISDRELPKMLSSWSTLGRLLYGRKGVMLAAVARKWRFRGYSQYKSHARTRSVSTFLSLRSLPRRLRACSNIFKRFEGRDLASARRAESRSSKAISFRWHWRYRNLITDQSRTPPGDVQSLMAPKECLSDLLFCPIAHQFEAFLIIKTGI